MRTSEISRRLHRAVEMDGGTVSGHLNCVRRAARILVPVVEQIIHEEVKLTDELSRRFVESVQDYAIFTLDPEGYIVSWNVGAERSKGYKAREIVGQHFSRFYSLEDIAQDKPAEELRIAAATGRLEAQGWRLRKDGSRFWANVIVTALRDAAGKLLGFTKITRDITERQELEAGRQQLQLTDELLSHVSHELRSPLNAIYQFVTILLDGLGGELNSQQRQYLQVTLKNTRQLKSMIDDLLEVSQMQAGNARIEPQLAFIPSLIADIITTFQETAAAKGIALSSDIVSQVSSAHADPARVRQILTILIDNALKVTPANGTVKVQTRLFEKDPRFLLFELTDSGCGTRPGRTERIFERLHKTPDTGQAGRQGIGLGLHICKELVTRQGGQIWASSEPGKGTTISFTLAISSMASLIEPAFRIERTSGDSIVLVVTEMASPSDWLSSGAGMEWSHQVRDILGRCMHSDWDVLLPKMGAALGTEFFFIVAVTDEIGGEAITRRIREKLCGCDQIREWGLTYSAWYRLLRPAIRNADELMEDYVERMAMKIQEMVDEEVSRKVGVHDQ
jgi:PAS domain S-box-containing protein